MIEFLLTYFLSRTSLNLAFVARPHNVCGRSAGKAEGNASQHAATSAHFSRIDWAKLYPAFECHLKVDDLSVEERLAGLESLSYMLDYCGDGQDAKSWATVALLGGVKRLSQMLQDSSQEAVAYALWVLANLCCDAVDPNSAKTAADPLECSGDVAVLHCLKSNDPATLSPACGLCLNLSSNNLWCHALNSSIPRFEQLLDHENEQVAHFATATLRNLVVVGDDGMSGGEADGKNGGHNDPERSPDSSRGVSPSARRLVEKFEEERKVNAISQAHAKRVISNAVVERRRVREVAFIAKAMKRFQTLGAEARQVRLSGKYSPELLGYVWRVASSSMSIVDSTGTQAQTSS